jgi:hypothetical protein
MTATPNNNAAPERPDPGFLTSTVKCMGKETIERIKA